LNMINWYIKAGAVFLSSKVHAVLLFFYDLVSLS